ncbi:MAG: S-layer homology domain-containing protein [Clostridia bacterium]|nr:S-layer homology domain-containing protein [Clostridia bacterium]
MKKFLWITLILLIFCSQSYAFWDESTFIWAKDAVNKWQDKGIISGYEDGSFRGKNPITRAELLSIVNHLNGTKEKAVKRPANDVAEGLWFTDSVAMAVNHQIIALNENGNIRPYEYATREETMVILANLFQIEYEKDANTYLTTNFSDADEVAAENKTKVAGVVEFGFVKGYPDGTLRPLQYVTRAELIAMLDNCIEDIYGKGTYANQIVAKSIVINDKDVELQRSEIKDKIFVMDGAKENPPYIVNTNVGKGIHSRIGDIEIRREDEWETLTEKEDSEKIYTDPLIASIRYSETSWTNEDVIVTLKLEDKDYEIVNNGGKNKYTFETNGEFTFICKNSAGKTVKFLTEVDYIDRISPRLVAAVAKTETSAVVTVAVSEDDLSPIAKIAYTDGKTTASAALRGTKIIDNTFTVTEDGIYTIAVEDEAGNEERIYINITGLKEPTVDTAGTEPIVPVL